ncbi:MAG: ABC transporter ATP-binding protein [Chlamydiales bacterium]
MILQVRNLTTRLRMNSKCYTVVDHLSFDLKRGRTLALVGESGCGKSLTAQSLLGILPTPPALPPQGEVLFRGINLLGLSEARMSQIRGREIAMIFQNPTMALNPIYTIGYQMLEVVDTHLKLEAEAAQNLVLQTFKEVHLRDPLDLMKSYPHQLSGGMLQRVMIAMALICSPSILIADEPTTALDMTIQAQILLLLKEIQEKKGMAILIITHDMGVVAEIADEVIVMYGGKQIEEGDVETIFDYPAHPYTQALFAASPDHRGSRRYLPTIKGSVPPLEELPIGCPFHPRCPKAMDKCRSHPLSSFSLLQKNHKTSCWLYDQPSDLKYLHERTSKS